jgi:hypothetical protein
MRILLPPQTEHEPEYFAAVEHLSDAQLAGFGPDDLHQVRVAVSAYGVHLFGKVRIPAMPDDGPAYIHFRAFTGGPDDTATLHSIRTCSFLMVAYSIGLRNQAGNTEPRAVL